MGSSFRSVDPISKPDAGKAEGVVAVEAVGRNLNGEAVGSLIEVGGHLKVFGMAEAVGVFIAETGDFSAIKVLGFDGEKDKVVAKLRNDPFGFEIARVDKQLDAVARPKVPFSDFLKGAVDGDVEVEFLKVPRAIDVCK